MLKNSLISHTSHRVFTNLNATYMRCLEWKHAMIQANNGEVNKLKILFMWFNIWQRSCGYRFYRCFFHKVRFVFYKYADVYRSPIETPCDIHRMPLYISKLVQVSGQRKKLWKRYLPVPIWQKRIDALLLFFFFELDYVMWIMMKNGRRSKMKDHWYPAA